MNWGGGGAGEAQREIAAARLDAAVREGNERDFASLGRPRKLEELGAHGTIVFGFYLTGLSETEGFSLCDVAVGRDTIVFLDADRSAGPWSELGRIPRGGVSTSVEDLPEGRAVPNPEFAPNEPSFTVPGAVDVTALVVVRNAGVEIRCAFPDREGAQEAADAFAKQLAGQA
jgi:hypothetical protein